MTPQSSLQGHSLGVNSLAIDPTSPPTDSKLYDYDDDNQHTSGILYSAGRDGNIVAWKLTDMDLETTKYPVQAPHTIPPITHSSPAVSSRVPSLPRNVNTNSDPIPTPLKPVSSLLSSSQNDSSSRLINPSLTAFLNSVPRNDIPTIPAFPQNAVHGKTFFKVAGPIHTNWVNDILLVNNKKSIVSCSSDLTVKLWNPHNDTQITIGQHQDYVKCLATPTVDSPYIYSAGLDRTINCWDIESSTQNKQKNKLFSIHVGDNDKTSIYSLAASHNSPSSSIIAAGGPDATVRLWDSRSAASNAKPIASYLGHTDNIRSLIISENGKWVMSASADSSIKLWSVTAGRLLHTFDMHSDSVWSVSSQHPSLQVFYSSDRVGTILKTDLRGVGADIDKEGVCAVIANEHSGVSKVVSAGPYLWAATCNSRIHRWLDFDTTPYAFNKAFYQSPEASKTELEKPDKESEESSKQDGVTKSHFLTIDGNACLRFDKDYASKAALPSEDTATIATMDSSSVIYSILPDDDDDDDAAILDLEDTVVEPLYINPIETLQGKIGLIKHQLLPNRRHVLTLDTAGVIKLWDLIQAIELKSFGTGLSMDDVAESFKAYDVVSNWCQVTTRSGELFITLDQHSCFDAEVYADEILPTIGQDVLQKASSLNPTLDKLPADQRINLGKWVLANLFGHLVTVELEKDRLVRMQLVKKKESGQLNTKPLTANGSANANSQLSNQANGFSQNSVPATPAENTKSTPGLMGRLRSSFGKNKKDKEKKKEDDQSNERKTARPGSGLNSNNSMLTNTTYVPPAEPNPLLNHDFDDEPFVPTCNEPGLEKGQGEEVVLKDITSYIEKRYESKLCKLGRYKETIAEEDESQGLGREKSNNPFLSETDNDPVRIRSNNPFLDTGDPGSESQQEKPGAAKQVSSLDAYLASFLSPPSTLEAPILRIPGPTKLMISQLMPGSEGLVDLYRGSVEVSNSAAELSKIESLLPEWVTRAILLNRLPVKDETKTWFVLLSCSLEEQANPNIEPLPHIHSLYPAAGAPNQHGGPQPGHSGPGQPHIDHPNSNAPANGDANGSGGQANGAAAHVPGRFTGYHMLRAHKALSYLVEKLRNDATCHVVELEDPKTREEAIAHPERWLELTCHGQVVPKNMTLATARTRMWRSGGDMLLKYRRKEVCELESLKRA